MEFKDLARVGLSCRPNWKELEDKLYIHLISLENQKLRTCASHQASNYKFRTDDWPAMSLGRTHFAADRRPKDVRGPSHPLTESLAVSLLLVTRCEDGAYNMANSSSHPSRVLGAVPMPPVSTKRLHRQQV